MTLAVFPSITKAESLINPTKAKGEIRCIPGGVQLLLQNIQRFELCAEEHCQVRDHPGNNETILFPPEVTLHQHRVQWKFSDGHRLTVLDTTCEAISFCENVRCWFCTANIFNPECSPHTAIATMAILLYIAIAVIYLLCYVPVVLGKPIRIMGKILWYCFRGVARIVRRLWTNRRNPRRRQQRNIDALLRAPLIASFIACSIVITNGCHNIDVFSQETTICEFSPNGTKQCMYETTEIFKLNSFQKTACIRLLSNQSLVKELRLQWKQLRLSCIKEDILFTRNTIQRVVDSKRCAHMGSCVEQKCGSINVSSKIPELHQGNEYPGITRCVESCGGPGCGCFYPSSGCLFYRVFNVPVDERIYEIFRCHQWDELFEVEITSITDHGRKTRKRVILLKPTIPIRIDNMIISLNTVTMPPTPELSSTFISDGSQTAIWKYGIIMDPVTPIKTSPPAGNSKRPPKPPPLPASKPVDTGNVPMEKPGMSRKRMSSEENHDAP
ncbi:hypothetical protein TELCIR_00675 [Teladorsagia circumcincta]|uniref:Phlebovirus glycoprotein G2 fusion domain-containing protein n=1 Tax=Teladorsagia circumcincta TaxID=45464 RepID=A0A2G9V5I6_TELCI|nr:hypothetical protein TELCIR_00675 [Teladorsagia circumcincta]